MTYYTLMLKEDLSHFITIVLFILPMFFKTIFNLHKSATLIITHNLNLKLTETFIVGVHIQLVAFKRPEMFMM